MNKIEGDVIKVTRGSDFNFAISLNQPVRDSGGNITYDENGNMITEPRDASIGDVLIFSVKENMGETTPLIRKIITIEEVTNEIDIHLTKEDTTIGDLIAEPVEYQYDIHMNYDEPIIVYDDNGPKIFKLYPEGDNDE